jgi:hypothetical protein
MWSSSRALFFKAGVIEVASASTRIDAWSQAPAGSATFHRSSYFYIMGPPGSD